VPADAKFRHRYRWHVALFVATLATTTVAGAGHWTSFEVSLGRPLPALSWALAAQGLWFSIPLLGILAAHEFGHYWYCRRYDVAASLPYFIPAPPLINPLAGTFGAVIKIQEAFPSKRALFDIGVAGPIAGFLALLPVLAAGVWLSGTVRFPEDASLIYFGEPILFRAVAYARFGPLPDGVDIVLHPMGLAAWWGLLATALNLLPFGQLDGGHAVYALWGRRARLVSIGTVVAAGILTLWSSAWVSMTFMMLVMAFFLGFGHPQVVDETAPLDGRRRAVAAATFVIFVVSFTPVPIQFFVR
jgi:membrane-associated protease RseP (regulator of RpoE activity)